MTQIGVKDKYSKQLNKIKAIIKTENSIAITMPLKISVPKLNFQYLMKDQRRCFQYCNKECLNCIKFLKVK